MRVRPTASHDETPQDDFKRALTESYVQIEKLERFKWQAVKGRHPGQPGHDPAGWAEWVDAARALVEAARKLHRAGP